MSFNMLIWAVGCIVSIPQTEVAVISLTDNSAKRSIQRWRNPETHVRSLDVVGGVGVEILKSRPEPGSESQRVILICDDGIDFPLSSGFLRSQEVFEVAETLADFLKVPLVEPKEFVVKSGYEQESKEEDGEEGKELTDADWDYDKKNQ